MGQPGASPASRGDDIPDGNESVDDLRDDTGSGSGSVPIGCAEVSSMPSPDGSLYGSVLATQINPS